MLTVSIIGNAIEVLWLKTNDDDDDDDDDG